jgi:LmbE family N-acetylglucosaminyl deacetylase
MSPPLLGSLTGLPRRVYRRRRERRAEREERRFRSALEVDPDAPELVLSPHLDDAVLDCWSVLASEREVRVVNIFSGAPADGQLAIWDAITGAEDSAQRVRERLAEDARALAGAGREPANLGLLDSQYRLGAPEPALQRIDGAIAALVSAASRLYVPAGIGAHADHVLARRYGRMLLRAGMPVTLYAELPYCVLHGWPSWVDGRPAEPYRNVDAFWHSFLAALPEMPPLRSARVERLDDERAAAKLAALRCYETQFPCLNYGGRGLLEDPEIHRFEVHWELATGPGRAAEGAQAASG